MCLLISPGQNGRLFADDIFRCIFANESLVFWLKISLKFVPKVPIQPDTGSDNGLVPNRRQAIIWTNADPIHWRIYAAQGGDELTVSVSVGPGVSGSLSVGTRADDIHGWGIGGMRPFWTNRRLVSPLAQHAWKVCVPGGIIIWKLFPH